MPCAQEEREDCFDEAEGLEFISSEMGLAGGALPPEGVEIAALVGYQKVSSWTTTKSMEDSHGDTG